MKTEQCHFVNGALIMVKFNSSLFSFIDNSFSRNFLTEIHFSIKIDQFSYRHLNYARILRIEVEQKNFQAQAVKFYFEWKFV